jgi:hypothetical protein
VLPSPEQSPPDAARLLKGRTKRIGVLQEKGKAIKKGGFKSVQANAGTRGQEKESRRKNSALPIHTQDAVRQRRGSW